MCASVPPSFPAFLPLCHVHVVFVFACGGGCWEMLFVAEVRCRLALGFYVPPTPSLFAAAAVVLVVVVVVVVSVPCFNALPPRAVARTGPSAPRFVALLSRSWAWRPPVALLALPA